MHRTITREIGGQVYGLRYTARALWMYQQDTGAELLNDLQDLQLAAERDKQIRVTVLVKMLKPGLECARRHAQRHKVDGVRESEWKAEDALDVADDLSVLEMLGWIGEAVTAAMQANPGGEAEPDEGKAAATD